MQTETGHKMASMGLFLLQDGTNWLASKSIVGTGECAPVYSWSPIKQWPADISYRRDPPGPSELDFAYITNVTCALLALQTGTAEKMTHNTQGSVQCTAVIDHGCRVTRTTGTGIADAA